MFQYLKWVSKNRDSILMDNRSKKKTLVFVICSLSTFENISLNTMLRATNNSLFKVLKTETSSRDYFF